MARLYGSPSRCLGSTFWLSGSERPNRINLTWVVGADATLAVRFKRRLDARFFVS